MSGILGVTTSSAPDDDLQKAIYNLSTADYYSKLKVCSAEYQTLNASDRIKFCSYVMKALYGADCKKFIAHVLCFGDKIPQSELIPHLPGLVENDALWIVDLVQMHYQSYERDQIELKLWQLISDKYRQSAADSCKIGYYEYYLCKILSSNYLTNDAAFSFDIIVPVAFQHNSDLYKELHKRKLVKQEYLSKHLIGYIHTPELFLRVAQTIFLNGVAVSPEASGSKPIDLSIIFDSCGLSLLDNAVAAKGLGDDRVIDCILNSGVDVNAKNKAGHTVLRYVNPTDAKLIAKIFEKGYKPTADLIDAEYLDLILLNFSRFSELCRLNHPKTKRNLLHLIFAQSETYLWRYNSEINTVLDFIQANCPQQIYNPEDSEVALEDPVIMAFCRGWFTDKLMQFSCFRNSITRYPRGSLVQVSLCYGRIHTALALAVHPRFELSPEQNYSALQTLLDCYTHSQDAFAKEVYTESDYFKLLTILTKGAMPYAELETCSRVFATAVWKNLWDYATYFLQNGFTIFTPSGKVYETSVYSLYHLIRMAQSSPKAQLLLECILKNKLINFSITDNNGNTLFDGIFEYFRSGDGVTILKNFLASLPVDDFILGLAILERHYPVLKDKITSYLCRDLLQDEPLSEEHVAESDQDFTTDPIAVCIERKLAVLTFSCRTNTQVVDHLDNAEYVQRVLRLAPTVS